MDSKIQLIIISIVLGLLLIYYLIKALKYGWIKKIKQTVLSACKEAEQKWPNGAGANKKQYVLEKVCETCSELGIPYAFIKKLVIKLIEQIVSNYNNFIK